MLYVISNSKLNWTFLSAKDQVRTCKFIKDLFQDSIPQCWKHWLRKSPSLYGVEESEIFCHFFQTLTPIISRSHVVWLPEFQGSGAKRERNSNTHFAIYSHQKSQTFRNRLSWRKAVRFLMPHGRRIQMIFFCFSSVFAKCCKLFLLLHEYDITFYVPKRYDVVLGPSDFLGINILLKNGILNSTQFKR